MASTEFATPSDRVTEGMGFVSNGSGITFWAMPVKQYPEMDVVLADEFRDGNAPAQMAPLTVAQAAFAAAPKTVTSYYYRGDSACHEKGLLRWLLNEKREDGPGGFIGLAISARMSEALHTAILEVPESGWKAYGKPEPDVDRECAEVVFVSNEELEPQGAKPLRYVAIRLRKRQGGLFADGSSVLHFAVLSNIWDWEPVKLVEWHREKAGTYTQFLHRQRWPSTTSDISALPKLPTLPFSRGDGFRGLPKVCVRYNLSLCLPSCRS